MSGFLVPIVVVVLVVLVVIYVYAFALMHAAGRIPPRMPDTADDEDWTDDLVDATAAGLIDWEE